MKRLIVLLLLVNLSILLFKFGNYTIQTNIVYITNYNTPKDVVIKKEPDNNRAITSTEASTDVPNEVPNEVLPTEILPTEVLPTEVLPKVPTEVLPTEVLPKVQPDVLPNEVLKETPPLALHPLAVHPLAVHSLDNDIDERVAKILLSFQKMNFTDSVYSYM